MPGLVLVFLAVAAILGRRLPADEIAHPLDAPVGAEEVASPPVT